MKKRPALEIEQLSVNYEKTPALWNVSLSVPEGKLVAIVGPNGAGKSTLLKTVLGQIKPISGHICLCGASLKAMRKKLAYVPQRESVDWDFPITVFDLVLMGCYGSLGLFRRPSKREREQAEAVLAEVGLEAFSHRQIGQLSGGQQQRAFLARALMQEADVYFLDEPYAGIDVASSQTITAILKRLRDQGKTLFVVHHDLGDVAELFDWAILLNMRLVACGAVEEVFTPEMIQKTYGTQTLIFGEASRLSHDIAQGLSTP